MTVETQRLAKALPDETGSTCDYDLHDLLLSRRYHEAPSFLLRRLMIRCNHQPFAPPTEILADLRNEDG